MEKYVTVINFKRKNQKAHASDLFDSLDEARQRAKELLHCKNISSVDILKSESENGYFQTCIYYNGVTFIENISNK